MRGIGSPPRNNTTPRNRRPNSPGAAPNAVVNVNKVGSAPSQPMNNANVRVTVNKTG
jgi:hypothetical protein